MKSFFILLTSFLFSSTLLAQSNADLSTKAALVAEVLQEVEGQLSPLDKKYIRESLNLSLEILSNYGDTSGVTPGYGGKQKFICISNGQSGVWEKFSVMDIKNNTKLGGETSKTQCQASIEKSNFNFICTSNGQSGVWEKFSIYNLKANSKLGGETSFEKCTEITNSSKNGLICVSNSQSGVWERFSIYDSKSGDKFGGETSYESCGTLVKKSTRHLVCASNGQSGVWEKFKLINRTTNSVIGGETSLENCLETIR